MPTRKNFPERREQRKVEAQERQALHDALTVDQKVDKLKARDGMSMKEHARLVGYKALDEETEGYSPADREGW